MIPFAYLVKRSTHRHTDQNHHTPLLIHPGIDLALLARSLSIAFP